jgi:3-hydroxyisobutyrate dehydrogenase-like beta-hydroxyacid dehydrogenase
MGMTVAVISAGAMGAAVGARLHEHGLTVITPLTGRSPETIARARAAGMREAQDQELAQADLIVSIVAPNHALEVARSVRALCEESGRTPIYVEANATSPALCRTIAGIIQPAGGGFVDGCIIGGPPVAGSPGPTGYLSGEAAAAGAVLTQGGLRVRTLEGGVGAASALKMSYAGLSKGLTALGACMLLAAERAGVGEALRNELSESQAPILRRLGAAVPDMLPKARRWVPEMLEIQAFIGEGRLGGDIYGAVAAFYEELARDRGGARQLCDVLEAALKGRET